jgi:hypothetical protein
VTETASFTTTETSVQTVTDTTSTATTTTSTPSVQKLEVQIGYIVTNETICQANQGAHCNWSGAISWPTAACNYMYTCQGLQLSSLTGTHTYPVTLGECGIAVSWSLSMSSPANDAQLSITITHSLGAVLYQGSTTPQSTSMSGSYSPC